MRQRHFAEDWAAASIRRPVALKRGYERRSRQSRDFAGVFNRHVGHRGDAEYRVHGRGPARRQAHIIAEEVATRHRSVKDVEGGRAQALLVALVGDFCAVSGGSAEECEIVGTLEARCVRVITEIVVRNHYRLAVG